MRESQYGDEEDKEELRHILNNSYDHINDLTSFPLYSIEIQNSNPHNQCS